MGTVETYRGPVDTDQLGTVYMHEHVFVLSSEVQQNWPDFDEGAEIERAVRELGGLASQQVGTIVDPTVLGLGRYVPRVLKVALRVPLNIVAATGVYTYNDLPHYFDYRTGAGDDDPMVSMFVRDIEEGIQGTEVRAGILKCATDAQGMTPGVERVLRAVARAHRLTGVPITTHTHAASRQGLAQQRILAEEGVDLSRVVIGHSGDSTDIAYLEDLMAAGSTLGMDRFGIDLFCPFEDRVATVATLCARGHADQLVLSHDAACHIDWFDRALREAALPRWSFSHLHDDVVPALRERGVTDEQLNQMLVENPKRILARGEPYP